MPGKARVHELAKELGVDSKTILATLKDLGEFVKSASSTVEAPVVRRLREAMPAPAAGAAPPAPSVAPVAPAAPVSPGRPGPAPAPERPAAGPSPAPLAPAAAAPTAPARSAVAPAPRPGAPRPAGPGNNPYSTPAPPPPMRQTPERPDPRPAPGGFPTTPQGAPAPRPVPGVSPAPGAFPARTGPAGPAGPGGMPPRPGAAGPAGPRPSPGAFPARPGAAGPGGPRPGPGAFPGGPRPGPGAFPARPGGPGGAGPGGPRPAGGGYGARPGAPGARPGAPGAGGGGYGARPGGAPGGAPGGGGFGAPRPGGFAGRPGGPNRGGGARGGTVGGAFGRGPGGRPTRGRKSKKQRRQEFDNLAAPTMGASVARGQGQVVRLPRGASLADFADRIDVEPGALVQIVFTSLGEMVTATQSCTDETLLLLGEHLGYDVQIVTPEEEDAAILARYDIEFDGDYDDALLVARPPVVTVMGHVDHGKTRLLDAIRTTNVQAKEAGGITQHIGAYQVHAEVNGEDRALTFIDTPGHESFTAMRARGAQVTDIVILVVAADDGVKPQTIEALNHAQAAGVPIVVAVNKIDKEGADPAKVRGQLTEYGLVAEEYGGETIFVDVSARAGTNIGGLLEAVVLTADASLDMRAPADAAAQGVAIEGHLDRGRGPVATVLIQRGTLHIGDSVVAGDAYGRVRALLDENGAHLTEAGPARPVQVLGFTSVPGAGDNFLVADDDRVARQIAEQRQARERQAELAKSRGRPTLETIMAQIEAGKTTQLNLILKGDQSGSVEALEDALLQLDVGEEVSLRIIDRGVGAITENNVMLASASDAVILGYNVRPEGKARDLSVKEGVDVRYYSVIYQAIEDVENALKGMLKPIYETVDLGTAEVLAIFKVPRIGNIGGCRVRGGTITRNSKARLVRDGVVVADNLTVQSLRREKEDATEVRDGFECGIGLGYSDLKIGDTIETFEQREVPRT